MKKKETQKSTPSKKNKQKKSSKQPPQNKMRLNNKVLKAKEIILRNREALSGEGSFSADEQKKQKRKKIFRIIRKSVCWVLLAILAMALVFFVLIRANGGTPTVFGYSIQRVTSGSMIPTLEIGDIFISKSVQSPDEVEVGDIITFTDSPDYGSKNVTHRIVKGPYKTIDGDYYLVTRGDANNTDDTKISFSNVKSKFLSKMDFLNKAYDFFLSPAGLLIFFAVLILIYFDELLTFAKVLTGLYNPEDDEEYREEIEQERQEEEKRRKEEELRAYKRKNWRKYDNTSKKKKKNRKKNKKKVKQDRFI